VHDGANPRHIVIIRSAAQTVNQQLLDDDADKLGRVAQKRFPQSLYPVQFGAVYEYAGGIDRASIIRDAPLSDGVKVFHGKADWVHDLVTTGARLHLAVHLHLLAHGRRAAGVDGGGLLF